MHRPAGRAERLCRDGGAVERLARAYERDADRRRDLLQEIHIALWRSLARFEGGCSMRTWVYRVAHNVATLHVLRPRTQMPIFVAIEDVEELDAASIAEITGLGAGAVATRVHRIKQFLTTRFHAGAGDE